MAIYKEIENEPKKVTKWLSKNERLGTEDFVCFFKDYLDYSSNNDEVHLKLFFLFNDEFDVYVNRKDFKYTIEFLETFDDLYWIKRLIKQ